MQIRPKDSMTMFALDELAESTTLIPLLSIAVSALAILNEFVLAQLLAALYGNSILRYSLTTGLYIAALGVGALCAALRPAPNSARRFVQVELVVASCGILAPILCLSSALSPWTEWLAYVFIIVIGILSGIEVPLLMGMQAAASPVPTAAQRVIGFDYLGSFVGAIAFPWLFKHSGVVALPLYLGMLSLAIAASVAFIYCRQEMTRPRILVGAVLAMVLLGLSLSEARIRDEFSRVIYSVRS